MRIAFLLYEKALRIIYAYLFSLSKKAMRIKAYAILEEHRVK